jgi:hypothetical protein
MTNRSHQLHIDPASSPDKTVRTMFLPHAGHPGCGYTLLMDEEIDLYRIGLFPVRCKSCREMMPPAEEL